MSMFKLTNGALETILTGGTIEKPTIQVLGVKKIQNQTNTGPDRYRLLLSDGVHSVSSVMLATQLNGKVEQGEVETNCVIAMERFICNTIQTDKKVIVLLELRVLGSHTGKIGDPQALKQPVDKKTNNNNNNSVQQDKSKSFNNNTNNSSSSSNNTSTNHNSSSSTNQKTASQATPSKIFPIASLTPYLGRWSIKARVTLKTKIRTWSNAKGEGQLFSFNLADQSAEIKVTAFKNEVDRFFNLIELNKVYIIKRGQLKAANKQFSNLANDYEMSLSSDSEIIPVDVQEEEGLPEVVYNLVTIDQVQNVAPNTFIDVIGVVKGVEDVKVVTQKATNRELKKRDVFLVDQSNTMIRLTLWGDNAEQFEGSGNPVMVLRGCKVTDWNGRSLGESSNTQLIMNPAMKEADVLRGWWDGVGNGVEFAEYKRDGAGGSASQGGTQWLTFEELSARDLDDRAEYFQTKATITAVKKDNCLYMACPQAECNKKVVDLGNSMYRCEKCAQEFSDFKWRLILQMNVCDLTGNQWLTCFQDSAELILQSTAQNIGVLKQDDSPAFEDIFNKANFSSFVFKNRARMEKYNDENRMKTVCLQASSVDQVEHSERLLTEMGKLLGDV